MSRSELDNRKAEVWPVNNEYDYKIGRQKAFFQLLIKTTTVSVNHGLTKKYNSWVCF